MSGSMVAKLIRIALLTPMWWGLVLLMFAAVADAFPRSRPQVFRFFARLGGVTSAAKTADRRWPHAA